jgi:hypothetical protein
MIKGRWHPRRGRVTQLALVTESGQNMVWICRLGEIYRMTLIAIRVHQLVVGVDVAGQTCRQCVLACQRELRRIVVE